MMFHDSARQREAMIRFQLEMEGIRERFVEEDVRNGVVSSTAGPPWPPVGISVEDWDLLISAVRVRLRAAMEDARRAPSISIPPLEQAIVLDCIEALGQLQTTMRSTCEPQRVERIAHTPRHDSTSA